MQDFLAIEAAPPSGSALHRHVIYGRCWTEGLVQMIDVADFRRAGVCAPYACRVGHRGTQFLPDRRGILEHVNGVAERFRHLGLSVESHYAAGRSQKWLGLRKETGRRLIHRPRFCTARERMLI